MKIVLANCWFGKLGPLSVSLKLIKTTTTLEELILQCIGRERLWKVSNFRSLRCEIGIHRWEIETRWPGTIHCVKQNNQTNYPYLKKKRKKKKKFSMQEPLKRPSNFEYFVAPRHCPQ